MRRNQDVVHAGRMQTSKFAEPALEAFAGP